MQTAPTQGPRELRRFRIGLVGASQTQQHALTRILSCTQYRTRSYELLPLQVHQLRARTRVDLVLMCSNDPQIVNIWARHTDNEEASPRPLVLLSPPNSAVSGKYQLSSPVNPGKLNIRTRVFRPRFSGPLF